MDAPEQFKQQLDKALEEVKWEKIKLMLRKDPPDPKMVELVERMTKAIDELDPIVRETMRDNPEALAEWEDIMRMRDDPSDEEKS
jgi:NAD-specific glutamate dehydrogenase